MSRVEEAREELPPPFEVYGRDEIVNLPTPTPLIRGILNRGSVSLLYGEYGTAKSFLALDWAAHLATGKYWFGHEIGDPSKVLYIAAEGAGGLTKRLSAWEMEHHQLIPNDNFHIVRVAVRFGNNEEHYEHLTNLIKEEGYDQIMIDTLSRSTPGMDENGPDMAEVIERTFELKDAHSLEQTGT